MEGGLDTEQWLHISEQVFFLGEKKERKKSSPAWETVLLPGRQFSTGLLPTCTSVSRGTGCLCSGLSFERCLNNVRDSIFLWDRERFVYCVLK